MQTVLKSAVLIAALIFSQTSLAETFLLKIEAQCPDPDILYEIQKATNDEARALKDTKLVSDETANVRVRISATPIQSEDKDKPGLKGIAIAAIVTRVVAKDAEQMRRFTHQLVNMHDYRAAVRAIVKNSIAQ